MKVGWSHHLFMSKPVWTPCSCPQSIYCWEETLSAKIKQILFGQLWTSYNFWEWTSGCVMRMRRRCPLDTNNRMEVVTNAHQQWSPPIELLPSTVNPTNCQPTTSSASVDLQNKHSPSVSLTRFGFYPTFAFLCLLNDPVSSNVEHPFARQGSSIWFGDFGESWDFYLLSGFGIRHPWWSLPLWVWFGSQMSCCWSDYWLGCWSSCYGRELARISAANYSTSPTRSTLYCCCQPNMFNISNFFLFCFCKNLADG